MAVSKNKQASSGESAENPPPRLPRNQRPPEGSPISRAVFPPGWRDDEPIFDLRGLRPEIATAMMMQHVLGQHFWAQITLKGFSVTRYAKKIGLPAPDLWNFFNGNRLVRFSTIAALYTALPEENWPDMVVVEAKVGIIRNRSEEWMSQQK